MRQDRTIRELLLLVSVALLIVSCYAGIRLIGLDRSVTSDEPLWLGRSANFFRALSSGELEYTYQMSHPGAMTMWAGALAFLLQVPDYAELVRGEMTDPREVADVLRMIGYDPLHVMVAAKVSKVLFQTVFFGGALWFLRRLFSWQVMVLAGFLIAFGPFLTGHDSAMHVDGMFGITSFAAVLAFADAFRSGHGTIWPWVLGGVLAACAWMTRSTAGVLVLVAAGALLLQVWRDKRHGAGSEAWDGPLRSGLVWLGSGLVFSVLLMPALAAEPLPTLAELTLWPIKASLFGHEAPTWFLGEIHQGDAGWLFYPVTVLWRLTPVSLFGCMAFLLFIRYALQHGLISIAQTVTLGIMAAWVSVFVFGMGLSAKKFDRYILAAYPFLHLVASLGIIWLATWLTHRYRLTERVVVAVIAMAIGAQAVSDMSALPYQLDYFNPLLGGGARAEEVLQVGWGQGGDQAVAFILEEAGSEPTTVLTSDFPSVYDYFAPESVTFIRTYDAIPDDWQEYDYVIVSMQQRQRDMDDFVPILACTPPAHTVTIEGIRMMDVYRIADYTPCGNGA